MQYAMEQSGFHGSLAFLSVAQETVVVRWELPECDGEMNNRLINCRPYPSPKANSSVPEKQLATRLRGMTTPSDVSVFWSLVARKLMRPPKDIRTAVLMYRRALGCFVTGPCCRASACFARRQHPNGPSQGLPGRSVQCWI